MGGGGGVRPAGRGASLHAAGLGLLEPPVFGLFAAVVVSAEGHEIAYAGPVAVGVCSEVDLHCYADGLRTSYELYEDPVVEGMTMSLARAFASRAQDRVLGHHGAVHPVGRWRL